MGQAMIILEFPDPENPRAMAIYVAKAKQAFEGTPNMRMHLAVRGAAEEILAIVKPSKIDVSAKAESNLVLHAQRELSLIGEDPETIEWYLGVIRAFVSYRHSGGSAGASIPVINELLNYKNLSPLTDDPREWHRHDSEKAGVKGELWQNVRHGDAFSNDGGKHYYLLSEGSTFDNPGRLHESKKHDTNDEKDQT